MLSTTKFYFFCANQIKTNFVSQKQKLREAKSKLKLYHMISYFSYKLHKTAKNIEGRLLDKTK